MSGFRQMLLVVRVNEEEGEVGLSPVCLKKTTPNNFQHFPPGCGTR